MTGWDWAQWATLAVMAGGIGWTVRFGLGAMLRLTESLTHTHASTDEQLGVIRADVKAFFDRLEHEKAFLSAADQALREDLDRLAASLALSEQRITGLTNLTEMALASVQARDSWHQAFERSAATIGAFDALLQQHYAHVDKPRESPDDGWRYVLLQTDGSVGSIRKATAGNAPIRIERGHGDAHSWYRLTRIEGNALIYTPEPTV